MSAHVLAAFASVILLLPTPLTTSAPVPLSHLPQPPLPPAPVAAAGLTTLKSFVTAQTYQRLGFNSVAEALGATLGVPVRRYFVPVQAVRTYQGTDPHPLLGGVDATLYPVNVPAGVRSSITIVKTATGWEARRFGSPNLIRALDHARTVDMNRTNTPASAYGLVDIPSVELSFLTVDQNAKLFLIPLFDDAQLGFHAGFRQRAELVLLRLVKLANHYNGQPG